MILTILTILISIGYSALNQNLSVSGEAFLRSHGNVRITGVKSSSSASEGFESYTPEYSKKGTKTFTTLPNSSSSVTYTVQMNNTTGVKYKFDSVTVSNTNSNVECIPSVAENTIIEPGVSSFTIQVKYKSGVTITDKTDVCEIKYEFSMYDTTPPTLSVTLVSSTETTRTVKIIAEDEADGYGLSEDNVYKYYFSTSKTELAGGEWKTYKSGEEIVLEGLNQAKYLWVYPIKDRAGNINDSKTSTLNPYWISWYNFVSTYTVTYNTNGQFNHFTPKSSELTYSSFSNKTNDCIDIGEFILHDIKANDRIKLSFTIEYSNLEVDTSQDYTMYGQGSGDETKWSPGMHFSHFKLSGSGTYSYEGYLTLSSEQANNTFFYMHLRTDYIKSGSITIKDIRITKETIVATQKVKYGSNITDLPTATDKAYTFNGWYTSSVGGEQVTTSTTMPANDVTYYAHWTPITYTLTVNPNGGTLNGSTANRTYSMQYGETRGIANPTRDGYIFGGWTVSGTESSMNGTVFQMGTANATITAKWKSLKPSYTYTGQSQLIDDGSGNWRIKFLTSGTLTFTNLGTASSGIDVFLVGGGGGAGPHGGGGGGGYTATYKSITVATSQSYAIVVGAGGAGVKGDNVPGDGGTSSAFSKSAAGGKAGGRLVSSAYGGAGGSGGGASCAKLGLADTSGVVGGSNGSDGGSTSHWSGGKGQRTTTREFGESSGTLYSGGGGGYCGTGGAGGGGSAATVMNTNGVSGTTNTGGGGGAGKGSNISGGSGGSGIVVIRNHR